MKIQIGKDVLEARKSYGILGLMFSYPKNIIFESHGMADLHMLFVFFPIDAVFVKNNKVVLKKRCYPFQPFVSGCRCDYVIEICRKSRVKEGMRVKFLSRK